MKDNKSCAVLLAERMSNASISYVFGHPGGEVVDLIDAIEESGIRFVLTGREDAAGFMAQTVGRLTGVPGACLATLGPGACNLALSIGSAFLDRDPMIAISARTAINRERWSNKQNLNLNQMMEPLCKWSIALDGKATSATVDAGLKLASTPPYGPVYLTLPGDIATAMDRESTTPIIKPEPCVSDDSRFEIIVDAVNRARRPVAVVGSALDRLPSSCLINEFLIESGIPFAVTPQGKGVADESAPNFVGVVASAVGDAPIVEMLQASDCILGLGFDAVESGQSWHQHTPIHSLANAPTSYGDYQPIECSGDVASLVARLKESCVGDMAWKSAEITAVKDQVKSLMVPEKNIGARGMAPYYLLQALQQLLPDDTILTTDVGAHKLLVAQAWLARDPLGFLITNGMSSMGFGIPSAIAASIIFPDRPVVSIIGDGGFGMAVQELETACRVGASPLIVVCCDQALSIIKVAQDERALPHRGVDFAPVDWVRVSEGFGVAARAASDFEGLGKAVEEWAGSGKPTVIAAAIDASLYCGLSY